MKSMSSELFVNGWGQQPTMLHAVTGSYAQQKYNHNVMMGIYQHSSGCLFSYS